jgi:hypothetical protein
MIKGQKPSERGPVPHCLRCKTPELVALPDSPADAAFFECPVCHRHFTKAADGSLSFRWGNPITLLLYPVIFEQHPLERCEQAVSEFVSGRSFEAVQQAIDEIRLELDDPTQQLRNALQCCASEVDLRSYLRCAADRMEVVKQAI